MGVIKIELDGFKMINYKDRFDCISMSIVNCAEYLKFNYQMYALGKWQFSFADNDDLSEGLQPYKIRKTDALKRFHNVETVKLKNRGYNLGYVIKEILDEKTPVVVETDLYECEWTQGYQKYHFPHFFIIKGIESEKFIVCDSFFNKDNIQIDITQFVCKIIEIRYFVPDSEKMFNKLMVKEELLKDIYDYKNYGMSSEIICFADKLYNWEGIDKLTEQYSNGESMFPLADNIRIFMTNRLSYIEMIKYLQNNSGCDFDVSVRLAEQCVTSWRMLRIIILKNIMCGNENKNDVRKQFQKIALEEDEFISCFEKECLRL